VNGEFKYLNRTLAVLLFMGCSIAVHSQNRDVEFEHIGLREGLSQVSAYSIYEDYLGFIWIGTDDGLNRFDGYDFKVFQNSPQNGRSLSNNSVNDIFEDSKNNLWVGTDRGLNLLDRDKGEFTSFQFDFHDERSISSSTIWCLAKDANGVLWIGTANGLNRFDESDSSFTRFQLAYDRPGTLSNNNINCLLTDPLGNLWVGTNQGLNLWQPQEESFLRFSIPGDESLYGQAILSLAFSSDSSLFIGTNQGLYCLKNGEMAKEAINMPRDLSIHDLRFDRKNTLWIGTDEGLYQLSEGRRTPILHRHDEDIDRSLSGDRVTKIIEDHTGILWVGTFSAGVNIHYDEQRRFYHYDRKDMGSTVFPSDHVRCLEEINPGNYWIGTTNGIGTLAEVFVDDESLPSIPAEFRFQDVESIRHQDSIVVIGTHQNGLSILDLRTGELIKLEKGLGNEGLSDSRISDIEFMGDLIWVGTRGGGVNILEKDGTRVGQLSFDPTSKNSLRDNRITCLTPEGNEAMWIGTSSAGVQRYDPSTKSFQSYKMSTDSTTSLSNDKVLCMAYQNAILWIGTRGGGLNKLDLISGKVTVYATEDGLSNNVVSNILPDGQGRIWCTTNKGISVLEITNGSFVNYNDLDGLGNQAFNPGAAIMTSSKEMFFGGLQGMDVVSFEDIQLNTVLPPVFFTEFEAFNEDENNYDKRYSRSFIGEVGTIELPPEISLVTIGFTALNYRTPEKNRFQYRLKGASQDWTYIDDRRYVTFSGLPPGTYTLEVKAANNDGLWSETPGTMELVIEPSFFQTWIFKILVVLFITLLVYLYSRIRVSRIKKVNRLLEERVKVRTKQIAKERDEKAVLLQEIHHRVKNNLQIVNSLLRLQSHYVKDEEALWALDESQNRVMSMAMIHERMYKTENLANINIRDYISDLCRDIVRTYDLSDSVKLNLDIQVEKLNLDTLTPLGLIINEISSNAMKYAFPDGMTGSFTVSLVRLEGNRFKLSIGDDGIGIPLDLTDSEHDSLGTTLMESLSEQLNGKLERVEGKGTMYQLIFEEIQT
jgi:two-component sensor histidine kinase/ligand-binding sensor domain-containing protein